MTTSMRRTLAATPFLALALTLAGCATVPAAVEPGIGSAASPAATATATASTGWGFPVYDIPADPAVRYLTFANGLKVAILQNRTPQNTVAVRMGFDAGVIDESDAEAGLAHFLEHMAFNGSRNVPEGEMIKLLEREGLAFGADTNASTGLEDTIYKLDLPRNDPKLLDTALMLMRETASELVLDPAAIDRERGIIQSETRTRNTFARRRLKDYLDFVGPDTAFSQRLLTANLDANVDSFTARTLAGYYSRLYRPDNAALVVVGDLDPATAEAQIRAKFADWKPAGTPLAQTDKGKIDLARAMEARNFVDPGVPVIVTIDRFAPYADRPATEAEFRRRLLIELGTAVLDRRLAIIANGAEAPIISGNADASDYFDVASQTSLTLQAKETPEGWRDALRTGENELRRLVEHGVTEAELKEQLANFATRYRTAAEQAATRRSPALAEAILGTVQQQDIFVTPATRYALFQAFAPTITPALVADSAKGQFAGSQPLIHVSTKTAVDGGSARILAAYREAAGMAVAAPQASAAVAFGYSEFGAPSAIVSDTTVADLGIRQIRFANNVRLNLKQTDFETGRLRYRVRVGSGLLAIPKERAAEAVFVGAMSPTAATAKHSLDELQAILAGRQVSYGLGVSEDSFGVTGTTTMADFATQMQVSAAYVSDPGYRPEALTKWQALVPAIVAQLDATPAGVAQSQGARAGRQRRPALRGPLARGAAERRSRTAARRPRRSACRLPRRDFGRRRIRARAGDRCGGEEFRRAAPATRGTGRFHCRTAGPLRAGHRARHADPWRRGGPGAGAGVLARARRQRPAGNQHAGAADRGVRIATSGRGARETGCDLFAPGWRGPFRYLHRLWHSFQLDRGCAEGCRYRVRRGRGAHRSTARRPGRCRRDRARAAADAREGRAQPPREWLVAGRDRRIAAARRSPGPISHDRGAAARGDPGDAPGGGEAVPRSATRSASPDRAEDQIGGWIAPGARSRHRARVQPRAPHARSPA